MSRIIGIVLGLLATLSALLLTLQPDRLGPFSEAQGILSPGEPPLKPEAQASREEAPAALPAEPKAATELESTATPEPPPEPSPPPRREPEAQPAETLAGNPVDTGDRPPVPDLADVAAIDDTPRLTHRIWNPFRSELAARGFAKRLNAATGVEILIVQESTHRYQAVFPYRDDAELRAALGLIEGVTGLDLEAPDE